MIFVFGSNEAGRHGAGAAKTAMRYHGAEYGKGFGHYGNSFAIPTKDMNLRVLSIDLIKIYVDLFIQYAIANPDIRFKVTRIGTGLAGIDDATMAQLFVDAPSNVFFDSKWQEFLPTKNFWGTFD